MGFCRGRLAPHATPPLAQALGPLAAGQVGELARVEEGAAAVGALLVVDVGLRRKSELDQGLCAARAADVALGVGVEPVEGVAGVDVMGGGAAPGLIKIVAVKPQAVAVQAAFDGGASEVNGLHGAAALGAGD